MFRQQPRDSEFFARDFDNLTDWLVVQQKTKGKGRPRTEIALGCFRCSASNFFMPEI